ncbi:MAG: hypothetical protein ACO3EZ_15050 [Prochlorotrichaceae cyanobacterium]
MDAKALADELKISPKTVHTRAKALGITGSQVKQEGKEGRPATVFSPQECDRIRNYGKAQKPVTDGIYGTEDDAIAGGAMVLQQAIGSPLAAQFQAISSQLENVEDAAAQALSARIQAMPSRIMIKAAQRLKSSESLDLSAIVGILEAPALPAKVVTIDPAFI